MKLTETITQTHIKTVENVFGPNSSFISVKPDRDQKCVTIVVGAHYRDNVRANFSKRGLAELITELQAVHDAMKS